MERSEFIKNILPLREQMFRQTLHYLANEDDAEDLVQEALLKLWALRERIADKDKMLHLASVVVKNSSITFLKRKRATQSLSPANNLTNNCDAQRLLEEKEDRRKLECAIAQLTDKQRAMIRMRNVENLSYADIAQVMGTTESSVRGMICKARMAIMKQMKGTTK